jgi:hypothetical protein
MGKYQSIYISPQGQSVLRVDSAGRVPLRTITKRLGKSVTLARTRGPGLLVALWRNRQNLPALRARPPDWDWYNDDVTRLIYRQEVYGPAILIREESIPLDQLAEYYLPSHRYVEGLEILDIGLAQRYDLARQLGVVTLDWSELHRERELRQRAYFSSSPTEAELSVDEVDEDEIPPILLSPSARARRLRSQSRLNSEMSRRAATASTLATDSPLEEAE